MTGEAFYRASLLGLVSRPTWASWVSADRARRAVPRPLRPFVVVRTVYPRRFGLRDRER